jgi:hypothetical protein
MSRRKRKGERRFQFSTDDTAPEKITDRCVERREWRKSSGWIVNGAVNAVAAAKRQSEETSSKMVPQQRENELGIS